MSSEPPVPAGWDRLELAEDGPLPDTPPPDPESGPPERSLLLAAVWTDLVAMLVVGVAALVAVRIAGYALGLAALPWAAALAVAWWLVTSAAFLAVRRGLPGMLAMGVVYAAPVRSGRLAWVLGVALLEALALGLPALLGARRWPRALVAGCTVVTSDAARADGP